MIRWPRLCLTPYHQNLLLNYALNSTGKVKWWSIEIRTLWIWGKRWLPMLQGAPSAGHFLGSSLWNYPFSSEMVSFNVIFPLTSSMFNQDYKEGKRKMRSSNCFSAENCREENCRWKSYKMSKHAKGSVVVFTIGTMPYSWAHPALILGGSM